MLLLQRCRLAFNDILAFSVVQNSRFYEISRFLTFLQTWCLIYRPLISEVDFLHVLLGERFSSIESSEIFLKFNFLKKLCINN